jgi:hypothetical protein
MKKRNQNNLVGTFWLLMLERSKSASFSATKSLIYFTTETSMVFFDEAGNEAVEDYEISGKHILISRTGSKISIAAPDLLSAKDGHSVCYWCKLNERRKTIADDDLLGIISNKLWKTKLANNIWLYTACLCNVSGDLGMDRANLFSSYSTNSEFMMTGSWKLGSVLGYQFLIMEIGTSSRERIKILITHARKGQIAGQMLVDGQLLPLILQDAALAEVV